jgi:hypothetical protein
MMVFLSAFRAPKRPGFIKDNHLIAFGSLKCADSKGLIKKNDLSALNATTQ